MDKREVALQIVLKMIEADKIPALPYYPNTHTEQDCKDNAQSRGKVIAEFYNVILDTIKG